MNQTTLQEYFPIKSTNGKGSCKRLNLSLKKTPTKSPKLSLEQKNSEHVIEVSDDEESVNYKNEPNLSINSNSNSDSTILYTPETPNNTSIIGSSSEGIAGQIWVTPVDHVKKSNNYDSLSKSQSKSSSKRKYYSPTKKRNIIYSPSKVKRNLCAKLSQCHSNFQKQVCDEFTQASENMDDITVFLLNIIYQFRCHDNLKLLLSSSSCDLLDKAFNVQKPGMKLVCRLYWQQEGWRRLEQVKKTLIKDVDDSTAIVTKAITSLADCGFITIGNSDNGERFDFDDLVKLLRLEELKSICKDFKIKTKNKEDAVQSLRKLCLRRTNITNYLDCNKTTNESHILKVLRSKLGPCYKLSSLARTTLNELYILMYLGVDYTLIKEKRLELMLLNIKSNRETYPIASHMKIDNASVVFKSREEFECYINARSIYDDFEATTILPEKCELIERVYNLYNDISEERMWSYKELPVWLHRYTLPYIYVKILEAGILYLKKNNTEEYINLAKNILSTLINQNVFRQHKKSHWYLEKALLEDKYFKNSEGAAEVLLEAFNNLSEEDQDFLRPRAMWIAKRRSVSVNNTLKEKLLEMAKKNDVMEKNIKAKHIHKQPMEASKRGKIKFKTRTANEIVVQEAEEFCIDYYIKEGTYTEGGHWEGKMVTTIFFLLFWDIIYAELPGFKGIFLSYYQSYPLDMFTEGFYANRKALIEEKLKEIEESSMEHILLRMECIWESRQENELSGVHRGLGWARVAAVSACLAPRRLAALCRRLAADYRRAHSGFPDLTLWNSTTGAIAFVEVKTDSDRPSMKQLQWMHYLKQNGINTEFCYVGVNTSKVKARNTDYLNN